MILVTDSPSRTGATFVLSPGARVTSCDRLSTDDLVALAQRLDQLIAEQQQRRVALAVGCVT